MTSRDLSFGSLSHPIKVGVLHVGSVGSGSAVLMRWFWFLVVMVSVTQLCTWVSCGTLMVGDVLVCWL